jgi:hypothetical protein
VITTNASSMSVLLGCFYTTSGGLQSYEHPLHEVKAVPRVDSQEEAGRQHPPRRQRRRLVQPVLTAGFFHRLSPASLGCRSVYLMNR